VLTDF